METGNLIFWVIRVALCSYKGLSRSQAIEFQNKKSYEELEKELCVTEWTQFIIKMFNKYFVKKEIYSSDISKICGKRDTMSYFKASDEIYNNFPSYSSGNDDFYEALIQAIKEFHDTKVYNNKLNIKEDVRSYRPIASKKFNELTYEEFLRDVCLFDAVEYDLSFLYGGFGKYSEESFGGFKASSEVKNAFLTYKNGGKEMSLEQIVQKYQHMSMNDANELGVFVERILLDDSVKHYTLGSLFCNSKTLIIPATINNIPLKVLKGGSLVVHAEKLYLLGDVDKIECGFLDQCNIKEVIALGKINYINGNALNGYKSTPEDGIVYIKINGNPHYYAARISDSSLKNIKLPDDCKEICDGFISLSSLQTINLGSIIKIHDGAFNGADCLKEIVLPDTLEELGAYAFKQSAISKLTIGKKIKVIKNSTFQQCDNLKEVYIPENVELIKSDAFTYCDNLKVAKVHVDTVIEENAFDNQVKIEYYGISKKKIEISKKEVAVVKKINPTVKKELKTLTVEGNVFKNQYNVQGDFEAIHFVGKNILCEFSFQNLNKVKKVTVDGNIAMVDSCFFYDSELIKTVEKDDKYNYITINDNPHYAIIYGVDKKMVLSPDCKVVSASALQDCGIESIDFANVEFIGAYACQNDIRLKEIKMSEKVKIIDKNAFMFCALKEVTLPKSLKFLGADAFYGCEELKVVKIPKTCKVGKNAFPKQCNVIYY